MRTPDIKLAEKRKKQILDAASRGFIKSGFHNTGMQEICKLAGLSPGAVYRYFAGKEDIIEAIVAQEQQEIITEIDKISKSKNPKKSLLDFVESLSYELSQPEYNALTAEIIAEAGRNKKVAEIIAATETQSIQLLTSLLRVEAKNGRLQLIFTPTETAQIILALAYGFSTQALLMPKASAKKTALLARKMVEKIII